MSTASTKPNDATPQPPEDETPPNESPASGDPEGAAAAPPDQNTGDLAADQPQPETLDETLDETLAGAFSGASDDLAAAQQRIAQLEDEMTAFRDQALRAVSEAENTRRRLQQDLNTRLRYAHQDFARDLLMVADNLERALASVDGETRSQNETVDGFCVGIEMTVRTLQAAFEKAGVRPVVAENTLFDHRYHEALFEIPNPEVPEGTVLQVVESGYTIHDRLLRPAKVGVAKGGPKPQQSASQQGAHPYDKPVTAGSKVDTQT